MTSYDDVEREATHDWLNQREPPEHPDPGDLTWDTTLGKPLAIRFYATDDDNVTYEGDWIEATEVENEDTVTIRYENGHFIIEDTDDDG